MTYVSISEIAELLGRAEQVLLIAHVNPDADALGSTLATAMALEAKGVPAQVTFPDDPFEVPEGLRFLPGQDLIVAPQEVAGASVAMSMDASSSDRLGRVLETATGTPTFIAVDHHASFVPFAGLNLVDAEQPATGMLALQLVDALEVPLTTEIATCLYAAISSDTGSFKFPATTPDAMRAAARLMETGIDFAATAKALFDTKSRGFVALQAEVLTSLDMREVGDLTVAIATIPAAQRHARGVAFTQSEALIDAVRTIEGIDVAVVLKEDDGGVWRMSTRSLGVADVGAVCTSLGGGGHRLAAGFTGTTDPRLTLQGFLDAVAAPAS